jgi:hypothetical protein
MAQLRNPHKPPTRDLGRPQLIHCCQSRNSRYAINVNAATVQPMLQRKNKASFSVSPTPFTCMTDMDAPSAIE